MTELREVPERTDPTQATIDIDEARHAALVADSHLDAMSEDAGGILLHDALYDAERLRDARDALDTALVHIGRALLGSGELTQARVVEATGLSKRRISGTD